jgi:chloramphenicol O-acetyltransferase type A
MRSINLETWPRRKHFELFSGWDYPHFSMCAHVDLTAFRPFLKQHGFSFNVAIVYLLARTANAIPEFRFRIRGREVIEHEVVHPATTIMAKDDLFTFCFFEYVEQFSKFAAGAVEQIAAVQEHPLLEDDPERDDYLFMTSIPWVSFTSFMHPLDLHPADSIPRFAWGKFFTERGSIKMPLSVQGHHALIDGIHVGRFYDDIQESLNRPAFTLGCRTQSKR